MKLLLTLWTVLGNPWFVFCWIPRILYKHWLLPYVSPLVIHRSDFVYDSKLQIIHYQPTFSRIFFSQLIKKKTHFQSWILLMNTCCGFSWFLLRLLSGLKVMVKNLWKHCGICSGAKPKSLQNSKGKQFPVGFLRHLKNKQSKMNESR